MVKPSNPRLMARVLEAVTHLSEGKGSSARDVLDLVRTSSSLPGRNLAMQVQRALKHAVNAGLLQSRGGRYKALISLKPVPVNSANAGVVDNNNKEGNNDETTQQQYSVAKMVPQIAEGARSRCSMCNKRRRRSRKKRKSGTSRRRRKSSTHNQRHKRRARRRGDEEPEPKRKRRKVVAKGRDGGAPSVQRSGKVKVTSPDTKPDGNQELKMRMRQSDSSDSEDEVKHKKRDKMSSLGRRTSSPHRRSAQGNPRKSRKRTPSQNRNQQQMDNTEDQMDRDMDTEQVNNRDPPEPDTDACDLKDSGSGCSL